VQRLERSNDFRRERGGGRNFLDARIAAELLLEPLPLAEDACEIARAIQRHAHRAALIGERGENRLADPPHRVRDELHALVDVELPRGSDQTDVAFLDQIDQGDAAVLILFRNTDHETQVGTDEPLDRVLVAFTRTTTQLDLLLGRQQLVTADFPQVLIERAPLFGRTGETLEPRGGPPTPTLAVLCRAHPPLPLYFHPDHSRSRTIPRHDVFYACKDSARPRRTPRQDGCAGFRHV